MRRINVGIIGTGWCGGIRANACAANPLVDGLYIAEIKPERLAEVAAATNPRKATTEWRELLDIKEVDAIYISATPETTHYPIARDCLNAGKHVFLEKPIAMELREADELLDIARRKNLKFTIGYSQRFNPKQAYIKKCVVDGTIGEPVNALVSRHLSRSLGNKINTRTRLSPAAMEATHDIDWVLWCLEPAKPVRVYCQSVSNVNRYKNNTPDSSLITVTMDNGVIFTIGAGWILPPGYPNYSRTWIEFVGTGGALFVDDSRTDLRGDSRSLGIVRDDHRLADRHGRGEHVAEHREREAPPHVAGLAETRLALAERHDYDGHLAERLSAWPAPPDPTTQ